MLVLGNNKNPNGKTNLDCQLQLMRSLCHASGKNEGFLNGRPPRFGREQMRRTSLVGL